MAFLCAQYLPVIQGWFRHRMPGRPAEAEELAQRFIEQKFLERRLLEWAERERQRVGPIRFSRALKGAMRNFLVDDYRRVDRERALDEAVTAPWSTRDDEVMERLLLQQILDVAWRQLEESEHERGRGGRWEVLSPT